MWPPSHCYLIAAYLTSLVKSAVRLEQDKYSKFSMNIWLCETANKMKRMAGISL